MKRKLISAMLLAFTVWGTQAYPQDQQEESSAKVVGESVSVVSLFKAGKYEQAKPLIREMLARDYEELKKDSGSQEDLRLVLEAYLKCCIETQDFAQAIITLDQFDVSAGDVERNAKIAATRGNCYEELGQLFPALDNYRRAISLDPTLEIDRLWFAKLLLTSPHETYRNSTEAKKLLAGLEHLAETDSIFAELFASLEAEEGNFTKAVEYEELAFKLAKNEKSKGVAEAKIHFYKNETRPPFVIDTKEPIVKNSRHKLLSNGTVIVRAYGRAAYSIDHGAGEAARIVDTVHFGTVLNQAGAILISASTINPPQLRDPKIGQADRGRWLEDPIIEVYMTHPPKNLEPLLGRAHVTGVDSETGLALIHIEKFAKFGSHPVLAPIPFKPIERVIAPGDQLEFFASPTPSLVEGEVTSPIDESAPLPERPLLGAIRTCTSKDRDKMSFRHYWNGNQDPTSASMIFLTNQEATIGSTVLSEAGESVGIVQEVTAFDGRNIKVIIPADVVSRIAAQLLTSGYMYRDHLPLLVAPNPRGERGVHVLRTWGKEEAYHQLIDSTILAIEGTEVNSHADLLFAMEKSYQLLPETVECLILDAETNTRKTIKLPIDRDETLNPFGFGIR